MEKSSEENGVEEEPSVVPSVKGNGVAQTSIASKGKGVAEAFDDQA